MQKTLSAEEEARLARSAATDTGTFRDLYRHYFPRVYAYIACRTPTTWEAEDLTAEAFTRVLKGVTDFSYRGEGSLTAWIFTITRNCIRDFYRQHETIIALDAIPEPTTRAEDDPHQAVIRQERRHRLNRYLNKLPPRRRDVVTLRFFGGLRNYEIAEVMHLTERTVASHLSRALDDLRALYADEIEERSTS